MSWYQINCDHKTARYSNLEGNVMRTIASLWPVIHHIVSAWKVCTWAINTMKNREYIPKINLAGQTGKHSIYYESRGHSCPSFSSNRYNDIHDSKNEQY